MCLILNIQTQYKRRRYGDKDLYQFNNVHCVKAACVFIVSSLLKFYSVKCKIFAPPGCHEWGRGPWTSHDDHRVTWLCFWRKWQLALQHLLCIYVVFLLFYLVYMPTAKILTHRWDDSLWIQSLTLMKQY